MKLIVPEINRSHSLFLTLLTLDMTVLLVVVKVDSRGLINTNLDDFDKIFIPVVGYDRETATYSI